MTANPEPPPMMDLSGFTDPDTSLALAARGCPKAYTAIAKRHMVGREHVTMPMMLFGSFVSRMRGLHEAILREIEANNPHGAFPLLRAWAEVVALAIYVTKKPAYIDALVNDPRDGGPGRKSFAAIFDAIRDEAGNMKAVYAQLSDYSHFGSLGVWNVHSIDPDDDRVIRWSDVPQWRNEDHFKTACGLSRELAIAGQHYLNELGTVLIPPQPPAAQQSQPGTEAS